MRVVFCASEVFPFAKTGGLADVTGALPLALSKLGVTVDIFIPNYKCIDTSYSHEIVDENLSIINFSKNVTVYLIGHDHFYDRDGLYGDPSGDFSDNLERFQYFCLKILDVLSQRNIKAEIVHCHDWQTALIPVYLKTLYKDKACFTNVKSVLTIHNLVFQGVFPKEQYSILKLPQELFSDDGFAFHGQCNLLKAGIIYADKVNTVSPQYAKEIQGKEYGAGLQDVVLARDDKVLGILNGIDCDIWSAKTDSFISQNYTVDTVKFGKASNKETLRKVLDLPSENGFPILGFVGRLSHQKGIDLIVEALPSMLSLECQVIIQGVGDFGYEEKLRLLAQNNSDRFVFRPEFNDELAHLIYAGSDMFLMPSNFEPCGLSQLISMAYGTIPLVYKTGGLVDTIVAFEKQEHNANGFLFSEYTKSGFLHMIEEAKEVFKDKSKWHSLQEHAMKEDFSWEQSAKAYKELYQCLLSA